MNVSISIIIPAYNSESYIGQTIQAVLNQTFINFEVIIIDDCSSDNTLNIAQQYAVKDSRIKILSNSMNKGVARSRNKGINAATGEYIAFCDADDLWLPEKLQNQVDIIMNYKCDICYTAYSFIDAQGKSIKRKYHVPKTASLNSMLYENIIGCSTAVCKASILKQCKMREEYSHEDYVLWLELLHAGYCARGINEVLVLYRVLPTGRSGNKLLAAKNRWKIYRDFLQLPLVKSIYVFSVYVVRGIIKYYV